jgi:hypothetical protein
MRNVTVVSAGPAHEVMPHLHTLAALLNPKLLSVQKIACLGDEIGFAYGSLHVEEFAKIH